MILAKFFRRQCDHTRQHPRRLHNRQACRAAKCIDTLQLNHDVQALVEDARKRVRGIQPDRRQHRQNLLFKVAPRPAIEFCAPLRAKQNRHTAFFQSRQDRVVEQRVLPRHQRLGAQRHLADHFIDGETIDLAEGRIGVLLLFQTGKAYFVKLIQVRADDAQEAQALEQRKARVFGLRQHTFIEGEHAKLAVEQRQLGRIFFAGFHHDKYRQPV